VTGTARVPLMVLELGAANNVLVGRALGRRVCPTYEPDPDGVRTAAFRVYADPADSSWRFAMAAQDNAGTTGTVAAARAGSLTNGVWVHLTASAVPDSCLDATPRSVPASAHGLR
jgi:hypothetical protein